MSQDCIFCKIIRREIPSTSVYEDDKVLAFKDLHPKAPTHILFIPKTHIARLDDIQTSDAGVMKDLYEGILNFAKKNSLREPGFRTQINVGEGGGQIVFHLHVHLLSQQTLNI